MKTRTFNEIYSISRFDQRTMERRDDLKIRIRRRLGVLSVIPTQHVTSVLENSMLKPATGAKKRALVFPCKANGTHCTVRAPIWTCGNTP